MSYNSKFQVSIVYPRSSYEMVTSSGPSGEEVEIVLLQLEHPEDNNGPYVVRYQYYYPRNERKMVDKVIKNKSNSTNCLKLGQGKKKYCRCT